MLYPFALATQGWFFRVPLTDRARPIISVRLAANHKGYKIDVESDTEFFYFRASARDPLGKCEAVFVRMLAERSRMTQTDFESIRFASELFDTGWPHGTTKKYIYLNGLHIAETPLGTLGRTRTEWLPARHPPNMIPAEPDIQQGLK